MSQLFLFVDNAVSEALSEATVADSLDAEWTLEKFCHDNGKGWTQ